MNLLRALLKFLTNLFGQKKQLPALTAGQGSEAGNRSSASFHPGQQTYGSAEQPDSRPKSPAQIAQEEWNDVQTFIANFERSGTPMAGVDWQQPEHYWQVRSAIEAAQHAGKEKAQAVHEAGFQSVAHWDEVSNYVQAKWSALGTTDDGVPTVVVRDEFTNALLRSSNGAHAAAQSAAAAADPTLLQPEHGVTVEQWALSAVGMTKLPPNATPADVAAVLAQYGMDQARYDLANTAWQAKMQRDTTFVIATKYGEAFSGALGVTAGGAEPVSFERFCEIEAAQGAWSQQGLDINAQLRSVFGISPAEWGSYGTYWSPKLASDIALYRQFTQFSEKYRRKYQGLRSDADLSL